MSDIEFVDSPDDPPAVDPVPDPVRPRWRRWAQPAALALIAGVGALVVVSGVGSDDPAPVQQKKPVTPSVHIYHYAPWHERAIPYGGGSYIY